MLKNILLTGLLFFTAAQHSRGAIISVWDFEGSVNTPSTGVGSAALLGTTATFASGNGSAAGWNTSGYSTQGTGSGTRGVQFLASTSGFDSITVSFAHRASGTASRWAQVDYTLDGGTSWVTGFWNNSGSLSPHDTFSTFNVDFSSIAGTNNNSNFGFRVVSIFSPLAFDQNSTLAAFAANTAYMRANANAVYSPSNSTATGDYAGGGTWRFDNVTVNGITAVPEPTSMVLVGLVGVAGVAFRARRRLAEKA